MRERGARVVRRKRARGRDGAGIPNNAIEFRIGSDLDPKSTLRAACHHPRKGWLRAPLEVDREGRRDALYSGIRNDDRSCDWSEDTEEEQHEVDIEIVPEEHFSMNKMPCS